VPGSRCISVAGATDIAAYTRCNKIRREECIPPKRSCALLLIHLGYCDIYPQPDGTAIPIAKSLRFGKMRQDEFTSLVDATLRFAEEIGWDRDELLAKTKELAA